MGSPLSNVSANWKKTAGEVLTVNPNLPRRDIHAKAIKKRGDCAGVDDVGTTVAFRGAGFFQAKCRVCGKEEDDNGIEETHCGDSRVVSGKGVGRRKRVCIYLVRKGVG